MDIQPAQATFLSLRGDNVVTSGTSLEILPCVRILRGPALDLGASVEVVDDATSRTSLLLFPPGPSFPVELDFGPVGLARGQTLRLNVAHSNASDSTALTAQLNWMDSAGNLLSQSTVTVLRGQATFVDLPGDDVITRGTRLEIQPCIKILSGPSQSLRASLEAVDDISGKSSLILQAAQH